AFIVAQRQQHAIPYATACRALGGSQAWFYKWRNGGPPPRHARRDQRKCRHGATPPRHARRAKLKVEIARLFAVHRGTYGSPRVTADLRAAGWRVSQNTVAPLIRGLGLPARGATNANH